MSFKPAVLAMIVVAMLSPGAYAQTTEPQRNVTPDITIHVWGVAAGDFDTRIASYATLRDLLQQGLPPLRITDDPREIRRAEYALARRIRAARSDAHGGEIFTPEITAAFKDALVLETKPAVCEAILDDNPGPLLVRHQRHLSFAAAAVERATRHPDAPASASRGRQLPLRRSRAHPA